YLCELCRCLRGHERERLGRPHAVTGIDLAIVNGTHTVIDKIRLRHTVAADERREVTQCFDLNSPWREFRYQFVDAAHFAPSRSATISSMEARSSCWRATMRAISAFSSVILTVSRVSSCST